MAAFDPVPFFSRLDAFRGWDQDDRREALERLGDHCEVWSFQEGDIIRFPDEASSGRTWVVEGCLVVLEEPRPRYVGVAEALEAPVGVWVRGQTSGRFVVVPDAGWFDWLRKFPAAQKPDEALPPPLPAGWHRSPLTLEPGEVPVQVFRKSSLFLALRLALPAGFFLFFLGFGLVVDGVLDPPIPFGLLWFLPGVGMLVCLALGALQTWEWRVSALTVTDRSILVRQIDVGTHRSDFEKWPLEGIREAVFRRRSRWEALLGLVTLEIEGGPSQARLVFPGLVRNSRFLEVMEGLRRTQGREGPSRQQIRRTLADRWGHARTPVLERAVRSAPVRPRGVSWKREAGGSIWFRRHPWNLWKRCLPWLGWSALVLFLGVVAGTMAPGAVPWIAGIGAALLAVPLGRIAWEWWDWADDRLTIGDKIVLIHRKPLWGGEVRQEGALEDVQQVGVRKDSLAGLLLDFGVVTVNLGTTTPLVFADAAHPEWVQHEIFQRRTLQARNRERQAAQQRLEEVSEILDTWDEARKAGYFSERKEDA